MNTDIWLITAGVNVIYLYVWACCVADRKYR
jgi:hypothetical protein